MRFGKPKFRIGGIPSKRLSFGVDNASNSVPGQFGTGDWSIADNNTVNGATITITTLPNSNGSTIASVQYQVDGGAWTSLPAAAVGSYNVAGLSFNVAQNVAIRAVNAIGAGTASATKSVTPSGSADLDQYNARLSVSLTTSTALLYNAFFAALRNGATSGIDIVAYSDCIYVVAGPASQAARQNLINSSYSLTAVGAPTFTAFSGYLGDGSAAYLSSTINFSNGTTLGGRDDFQVDAVNAQGNYTVGSAAFISAATAVSIYPGGSSKVQGYQAMGNNFSRSTPGSVNIWDKLLSSARPNSSTQQPFFDGAASGTATTDASIAPSAGQFRLLVSSAGSYSSTRAKFIRAGRYLGAAGTLDLRNAVNTLLIGLGAI